MKRIESANTETVTLELTLQEFHAMRDTLSEAITRLEDILPKRRQLVGELAGLNEDQVYDLLSEEGFEEDTANDFQLELKCEETLLAHVYDLSDAMAKITREGELARML